MLVSKISKEKNKRKKDRHKCMFILEHGYDKASKHYGVSKQAAQQFLDRNIATAFLPAHCNLIKGKDLADKIEMWKKLYKYNSRLY